MITLRMHHLICLSNFIGKGYSEDFTRNMQEIKKHITEGSTKILLSEGCDDICRACPYRDREKNICSQEAKTARYDREWLAQYGLNTGDIITVEKAFSLADDEVFNRICGDCGWFEFCSQVRENGRQINTALQ